MDQWRLLGSERDHRTSVTHILVQKSYVTEFYPTVDFEQPRALYRDVMSDVDRQHLVSNIVDHVRTVKSAELKLRIREPLIASSV